ncbi:hypothetical protein HU200_009757 [Digitaria exilis]|uniref:Uncharacterized protein n=1 Tax=Digitaria exilis TaxID=1010633 RepID=A0A835FJD2_9POAL|nr:hypothetical protein HU200_009757 [Digitaria exilis]
MATLLLFLRVIVSATDESLTARRRRDAGGAEEEEERWLVACLEWPRVDRKSAWMQIV